MSETNKDNITPELYTEALEELKKYKMALMIACGTMRERMILEKVCCDCFDCTGCDPELYLKLAEGISKWN